MKIKKTLLFVIAILVSFVVSGQPMDSTRLLITTDKDTYAAIDTVWITIKNISTDSLSINHPSTILLEQYEDGQWVNHDISYPCNNILLPVSLFPNEELTVFWNQSQTIKDHWPQREQAPSGQYRFHLGFGFTSHYYYVRHQDNITIMQEHFLGCSSTFYLMK